MNKNNEINKLFGKKLRLLRMSKGLSQEELGLQSGIHRTYIGQIERAEKNITIQNVYRIAKTLELDIRELFDFSDIYKGNDDKNNK
jgi:transcriptional regulator with XRE-family HTH domain